jgi:hypothetical protein
MDVIEKVARAIWDSHELVDWPTADILDRGFHLKASHAAIRATLQHYAENVSEGMLEAALDASDYDMIPQDTFPAMLLQAIKELDA